MKSKTHNFLIAINWARSQSSEGLILSDQFLKPFSNKDREKILLVLIKTHYVFPFSKNGILFISHKSPYVNLTEIDGKLSGYYMKKDNNMVLLHDSFPFLIGKQHVVSN